MSKIDYGYCSVEGHGSYSDSERACPWCGIAELEARIAQEEARAIKAVKTWKEQAIRQREQRKAAEAALERVRGVPGKLHIIAIEIQAEGHYGWGNALVDIADTIDDALKEGE